MQLTGRLAYDLNRIEDDARQRLHPSGTSAHMATAIDELRQTFKIYEVPYTEDTLKAALATLLWSASGTQDMFLQRESPRPPHTTSALGKAVHGHLVSLAVVTEAARSYDEDES